MTRFSQETFSVAIVHRTTKAVKAVALHRETKRACKAYCRGFNRGGGAFEAVVLKPYK